MIRVVAGAAVLFFCGATLVLSELHWFRRRPLTERLAPYVPGAAGAGPSRPGTGPVAASWRQVAAPVCREVGDRLARIFGVAESPAVRLERIHSPLEPADFRLRQLGWAGVGFAVGTALAVGLDLPGPLLLAFVGGGPLLAFLVVEQRLASAAQAWSRRVFSELPVVAEQLGMLLGAGYSPGAALGRLAQRGSGACSRDLARVVARIRVGVDEIEALREWAAVADVPALDRLVAVLALNRRGGDLSRLIGAEARSIRRDAHRELIEAIERRAQQVWVPVTLATLVPGVIFLAVPFVDALRLFATT